MGLISINPPPTNGKCEVCGDVGTLTKTFRGDGVGTPISASWECEDCLPLDDDMIFHFRDIMSRIIKVRDQLKETQEGE